MNGAALEGVTDALLNALAGGEAIEPEALTFLLRRYAATDRADVRTALEPALAEAVERAGMARTTHARVAWLVLVTEASRLSDDERLRATAADLTVALRRGWGRAATIEEGAESVDGWLASWLRETDMVDAQESVASDRSSDAIVAEAIDELERIVAAAYRPGEGLAGCTESGARVQGRLIDHVRTSSALLTAFGVTGRLPYSMLAEELVQFVQRTVWSGERGMFSEPGLDRRTCLLLNCEAARVLCRLASLHGRADYQTAAVIVSGADYRDVAGRILTTVGEHRETDNGACAAFGLALADWLGLP